jgi:glutamate-1-semialdehyde aminotransferase
LLQCSRTESSCGRFARRSSCSSTASRGAPPSSASGRGARCPTASRWRGWPASTGTGRCSSPTPTAAASPTSTAPPTSTSTRPTSAPPPASPRPRCWRRSPSARPGLQFLLPVEEAIEAAELLAERYGLPGWQFTLSASGANAEAIRLARHRTGRDALVVFGGHYHGHLDDTLVKGDEHAAQPELLGLNPRAAAGTRIVAFNDLTTLERVLARGDVAAVITEPALTNVGIVLPDDGFHATLRELTRAHGSLLVLDETHTQTFAYGGLTRAWGLEPDIVALGKSTGGGIPVGAYGMTHDLRDHMERHRDVYVGGERGLATGGTTYANPLSLAATVATLRRIQTPQAFERIAALGARLADGIEAAAAVHGLTWRAHRLGGRSGYCLEPELPRNAEEAARSLDVELIDLRRLFMANRGVWDAIASAGPAASFAHTEPDVDEYLDVLEEFLDAVAR